MKFFILITAILVGRVSAANTLNVPATDGILSQPILMDINGFGTRSIGQISVSAGTGFLQINGKNLQTLIYHNSGAWTGTKNVDYQAIATDGTDWFLIFFQCQGNGSLGYVFYENFDGSGMLSEPTKNSSCSPSSIKSPAPVHFPAANLNSPSATSEWSIAGSHLSYQADVGGSFSSLDGTQFDVYPFHTVDCMKCGNPGWYELHSLFYQTKSQNLCFGIIYMKPASGAVSVQYSICLPSLTQPLNGNTDSTFRGPLSQ